ncbi:UDP-glucose 4-epimerase [Bacillus sp. Soil531]|nr:UDP-glucose 4-epimerase [Bacillus sp. Soil531]
MRKVLVTGGAGFIGSHIVEQLLEENYIVSVVDNLCTGNYSNIKNKNVDFYKCDIISEEFEEAVKEFKPDYIIHQAAQVSVSRSVEETLYDEQVNIRGSLNVMEAAKKYKVKKIIFASSAAVYGEPQYLPIDEEHVTNTVSPYGLSKFTVEEYLRLLNKFYGIEYTILRYSNVYGPRQDTKGEGGVVALFAEKVVQGIDVSIFGDGNQTRDFVYVKDVAGANIAAIKNGKNEIFNISTNSQISINDLLIQMNLHAESVVEAKYYDTRKGDIVHSVLANTYAKEVLKWTPRYSIQHGIKDTLEYYLAQNKYNRSVTV